MRGSPFSCGRFGCGGFRCRLRRLAADLAVGGNEVWNAVGFVIGNTVGSAVGFEVVFLAGAADPRLCADRAVLFRNRIILYIIA